MAISTISQNGLNAPLSLTSPTIATPTFTGQATIPTINLTGGQITFPATQSASSNANTLDDYEEGTWTVTDGSGAGLTITNNTTQYIKIGRLVFINCYISYPSTSSGATASISGFPFTPDTNGYSFLTGRSQTSSFGMISWQLGGGSNTAPARGNGGGTDVTNANLSTNYILISGCYYASA